MAFTRSAVRSRLAPPFPSRHGSRGSYLELPPAATPSVAIGALALGALAVGALAIGALAIGRLRILRAEADKLHLRTVEIDDLTVKRLRVVETASGNEPSEI
ncbi:hypothetical protein [Methyloceanibacter sp.]|uniref:hypothetical protein n=1 Tax=Methyloceanibacter sp. TaxID=1965321 RepID=UPI002D6D5A61|nr:hypothetical protein [Methyloceanibacter sp.]HZP09747.1 hypothetical protein [Methyloceanibacter sp.]